LEFDYFSGYYSFFNIQYSIERVWKMADFEPKIVAFLCNWCAYAGADLAGVSRLQYPSNIRPVRVMCSGRVDPLFIVKAFKEGCDGILVAG
jgi:F420-non-reducing hydrogenase iron-sulfur subunit